MPSVPRSSTNPEPPGRLTRIRPLIARATTVSPACGLGVGAGVAIGCGAGVAAGCGCGAAIENADVTASDRLPAASTVRRAKT